MAIDFTTGDIKQQLKKFAIPALISLFMIMTFHFIDTLFISRLGKDALTAMGFIAPVIMILLNFVFGFAMATLNLTSSAIGNKDYKKASILSSQNIIIANVFTIIISIISFFLIEEIFGLVGAPSNLIPMIKDYMIIWLIAYPIVSYLVVAEKIFFAKGDSITPKNSLVRAFLVNTLLDPIFIFGFWIIPATGMLGASLATAISRFVSVAYLTRKLLKGNMLSFDTKEIFKEFKNSFDVICKIAITSSFYYILIGAFPIVLNKFISSISLDAIAGIGAASKIEGFALIITIAIAIALSPFMGQNIGSKNFHRIKSALKYSFNFGLIYSLLCTIIFAIIGKYMIGIFTTDPTVIHYGKMYLLILAPSYMSHILIMEAHSLWSMVGMKKYSAISVVLQFILISLSMYLGAEFYGVSGAIAGLSISKFITGLHSYAKMKSVLTKMHKLES